MFELEELMESLRITTASNRAVQNITVWDENPPYFRDTASLGRIEEQHVSLEATDFGGVRLGRVLGTLQNDFDVIDACNRPTTLIPLDDPSTLLRIGETTPVRWQVNDGGPYEWDQVLAWSSS